MVVWKPLSNTWASSGSVDRNKGPIADALDGFILHETFRPKNILEIASGFGEHIKEFAKRHHDIQFQPTEAQEECLDVLSRLDTGNICGPQELNVLDRQDWDRVAALGITYEAIININMIHISPPASTAALFAGAASVLRDQGFIMLYGAFLRDDGTFNSEADDKFDSDLKSRDKAFGLRNPREVNDIAEKYGFQLIQSQDMALGNKVVFWRHSAVTVLH